MHAGRAAGDYGILNADRMGSGRSRMRSGHLTDLAGLLLM